MATLGRTRSMAGAGLILAGAILVAAALAFYVFGLSSRARLGDLVVAASGPLSLEELQRDLGPAPAAGDLGTGAPAPEDLGGQEETFPLPSAPAPRDVAAQPATPDETEVMAPLEGALAAPRPGLGFDFRTLRAEGTSATSGSAFGGQFQPVDWATLPATMEALPRASRIQIPAIGLDARVVELNTRWDGASLVWETAVFAVGHHRGSPNPGERGNAVFSGHISSPVKGEGAIFKRLPEVAVLLREGRTVDIIVEAGDRLYLYRAISTDVKEPEEVDVFRPAEIPSLTVVTCVPDYIYSHRLLVNAVLVGVAPKA